MGTRNGPSYDRDVLNGMVGYGSTVDNQRLGYRGDGMRVWKEHWGVPTGGGDAVGGGSGELDDPNPYTVILSREVYEYDGQTMSKIPTQSGLQQTNQVWTNGQPGGISHTQFVPGLRGVECSYTPNGKVNWSRLGRDLRFVHDGHGSVVATGDGPGRRGAKCGAFGARVRPTERSLAVARR